MMAFLLATFEYGLRVLLWLASVFVPKDQNLVLFQGTTLSHYDEDDMKATVVADCVTHVSKLIPAHEAAAESPGLALVHGPRARAQFCQSLDRLVRHDSSQGIYWLEVFNDLSRHDVPVRPWWFQEGWKWQEVDFHLDIEKARELLRIR